MNMFARSATGFFASKSLIGHLIRGCIGALLLIWAIQHQDQMAMSLGAALGALLAFRGCPICWAIGLVESIVQKLKRGETDNGPRFGRTPNISTSCNSAKETA